MDPWDGGFCASLPVQVRKILETEFGFALLCSYLSPCWPLAPTSLSTCLFPGPLADRGFVSLLVSHLPPYTCLGSMLVYIFFIRSPCPLHAAKLASILFLQTRLESHCLTWPSKKAAWTCGTWTAYFLSKQLTTGKGNEQNQTWNLQKQSGKETLA